MFYFEKNRDSYIHTKQTNILQTSQLIMDTWTFLFHLAYEDDICHYIFNCMLSITSLWVNIAIPSDKCKPK